MTNYPKSDRLRAMRERQHAERERKQAPARLAMMKTEGTRAALDKAIKEASAKVAKPKKGKRRGKPVHK